MRNLGNCFASPILLLLHNGATKYQTLISIIRQAPRGGAKGDQGIPGTKGANGVQGIQGQRGAVGNRGATGSAPAGNARGDMQYWDGTAWIMIPAPIMNYRGIDAGTLQFCNGVPGWDVLKDCPYIPNTTPNNHPPYYRGQNGPAGGAVFYVTDGGLHGLEAAPVDDLGPDYNGHVWGCYGKLIGTSPSVGKGASNTAKIIAGCSELNTLAKAAHAYNLNGYNDWYLPSQNELNLLYIERDRVCCFSNGLFASSTEFYEQPSNFALVLDFTNGGVSVNQEKNSGMLFRPIRSF